jgi:hypothetical protein
LGEQTRNLHLKGVIVRPQLIKKSSRTADEIKALVTAINAKNVGATTASEMESASGKPAAHDGISDTVTDRKSTAVLRINHAKKKASQDRSRDLVTDQIRTKQGSTWLYVEP